MFRLKVLPCHAPLELIASGLMNSFASSDIQIAGFGTNILSAAAFLGRPHGVSLCDKEAEGRIQRLWNFCFDGLFIDVNCCGNAMFERLSITSLKALH
jgi:hypothetical protein